MKVSYESYTDKGLRSGVNQDSIACIVGDDLSVFCVADGMGGHEHGEVASKAITDRIQDWYKQISKSKQLSFFEILDDFEKAITEVNTLIYEKYNQNGICGSTIVALLLYQNTFAIFSAGDSRVYRKRGLRFDQLTKDDIWQNDSKVRELIDEENLKKSRYYGKLTKCVGVSADLILNRVTGTLKPRDFFFLCCDGVYKCVSDRLIRKCRRKPDEIKTAVLEKGAPDNFSYIIVEQI